MSAATETTERRGTQIVRLQAGQTVKIDVVHCDLVPSMEPTDPAEFRFKGQLLGANGPTGEHVRLFIDREQIEPQLRRARIIGDVPELPPSEREMRVRLMYRRLEIGRVKGPSGATSYRVAVIDGTPQDGDEQLLADYHWAFAQARNAVVPLLEADRLAVGASDVLAVTATLFHERRRGRPGRG